MVTNPKINFKQAILSTFAFFDIFDYPLTKDEVEEYLYKLPPDTHQIDIYLRESPSISYSDGLYCLKGREENFVKTQERKEIAKKLWKKIDRFRKIFDMIPFIRMIAVGNNLSYDNPTKKSDIDLLIVTKPGRIFTARTLVTFWTHLFGSRRYGEKIKNRFCLSFYITEDNLNLEKISLEGQDIYLAYWIKNLQPISGDYHTYIDLIDTNRKYLSGFFQTPVNYQKRHYRQNKGLVKSLRIFQENLLSKNLGNKIESWLKKWQLKRMHKKLEELDKKEASIIISNQILKFHNVDRREYYRKRWEKKVAEIV
ncbi:MAG: hypothetical protein WCT46_00095 [Candidatus Gracilibacteria bacterium]